MKKFFFAVVAILTLGCGVDRTASTHCYVDGLDVTLEYRTDCFTVIKNIASAKRLLIDHSIISVGQFSVLFDGLNVNISHDTDLGCKNEIGPICTGWQWGRYQFYADGYAEIRLTCRMTVMLHEFLHRIEHKTGVWAARGVDQQGDTHSWWDQNGFNELDILYRNKYVIDGCYSIETEYAF